MLSRSNLACFFFHHTGEMSLSCFGLLWHRDLAANEGASGRWIENYFSLQQLARYSKAGVEKRVIIPGFSAPYHNRIWYHSSETDYLLSLYVASLSIKRQNCLKNFKAI